MDSSIIEFIILATAIILVLFLGFQWNPNELILGRFIIFCLGIKADNSQTFIEASALAEASFFPF